MSRKHIPTPPVSHFVDLSSLSQAGSLIDFAAQGEELMRLARWADVVAVHAFGAKVTLQKLSQTRFSFAAEFAADIEQKCVVTLEPVFSHIERNIARELRYSRRPVEDGGELTLAAGDDEAPDTIGDLHYDLVAPLLEEFSLAIDPYPKKDGASFAAPADATETPPNPFAVLESLKKSG